MPTMAISARHHRSRRTGPASSRSHSKQALKPIIPPILPPPLPPMPEEDKPAEVPRKAIPLVKTAYNTKQLRKLIAVGGFVLIVAIGAAVILGWQRFQAAVRTQTKASEYKLSAQAEKLDAAKAQLIMQQIRQATPSAVGQSTPGASAAPTEIAGQLSIPTAQELNTYSTDQLLTILDSQIQQLKSEKQSTRLLELLKSSGTKEDLLKAIQLGKEYQAQYLYYKK